MGQLALNVTLPDGFSFASFCPLPGNEDILTLLQTPFWRELPQLFLYGEGGSGKSHLLQACCYRLQEEFAAAHYLSLRELSRFGTGVMEGLSGNAVLLALDDVDAVLGNRAWEEALFHLINRCREQQQALLMSARSNPHELECSLPDLASRLLWGPIYSLRGTDEEQALEVFKWRAYNRGLDISESVAVYINRHFPRDLPSLIKILQKLDDVSLSHGKKITVPLLKQVLS